MKIGDSDAFRIFIGLLVPESIYLHIWNNSENRMHTYYYLGPRILQK